MDVVTAVKSYIQRMISDSGAGMKVLLMDKETIAIVSAVYSQSEILQKEVFLFELLSNAGRETMKHMSAICFVRPSHENIDALCAEFKLPKYASYYLYFANKVDRTTIERLATADDHESVREVKEFYADYLAISQHVYSLNMEHFTLAGLNYSRITDGILALLLSLKKRPVIRYTASSHRTERLADDLYKTIYHRQERELFDFVSDIPPLLLILDRRDDPVTPLLLQWTYQAMVHEFFGIKNHRVDLSHAQGIKKDLQEVVLSPEHDEFYKENMYNNFGDIGARIKELVDHFQQKQKSHAKIESIADMKAFVENYPQFRKLSGTVSKHVAVVSELSRVVSDHHLMSVSETEQDIVTQADRSSSLKNIESLISSASVRESDCLRLVMLFALRYESNPADIDRLLRKLAQRGVLEQRRKLVEELLHCCGQAKRTSKLFDSTNPFNPKKLFKGLKGVENVYTRHKPLINDTLEALIKRKLPESLYPFAGKKSYSDRPQDVIIFIVGGATYAEAMAVANINRSNQSVRIILGSNTIVNSQQFLDDIPRSSPAYTAKERLTHPV